MKIFYFATKQYEKDVRKSDPHGVAERIKGQLEHGVVEPGKYLSDTPFYRVKDKGCRHIFYVEKRCVENQWVKCFVAMRVLRHSDNPDKGEYERLYDSNYKLEERKRRLGVKQIPWNKIEQRIGMKELPGIIHQPLSQDERNFCEAPSGLVAEVLDIPVYESSTYVDLLGVHATKRLLPDICQTLYDKIIEIEKNAPSAVFSLELPHAPNDEELLCTHIKGDAGHGSWFILTVGTKENNEQWLRDNDIDETRLPNADVLMRKCKCKKAYPAGDLEDEGWWRDEIESVDAKDTNQDSNLNLTPEELSILAQGRPKFPLFISGRAGSGKSTVLRYLFAEYFLRYVLQGEKTKAPPVYVSYTDELVEKAKASVKSILTRKKKYHDKLMKSIPGISNLKDWVEDKLKGMFFSFRDLLREAMAKADASSLGRFAKSNDVVENDRYISYSDFRKEFECQFHGAEFGAEFCWHIIRTYIKGWDSEPDGYLEPEDYTEIGRKNQSVAQEHYQKVYKNVWEGWYKSKYRGGDGKEYWDDQDLVREYLKVARSEGGEMATGLYSGIFCDEAQDFTQVELEAILRLSIYSKRQIKKQEEWEALPFAFAGDEFQTINPTGFSWDSMRANFGRKMAELIDCPNALHEPKPALLAVNYRSAAAIVRFCNSLLLLKTTRCKDENPSAPQVPYYLVGGGGAYYLPCDEKKVWESLQKNDVAIIVAVDQGQDAKKYLQDKLEKLNVWEALDEDPQKKLQQLVFSPAQIKGMERPNVALLDFDGTQEMTFETLTRWYQQRPNDKDEDYIKNKYFLNNLYVAATRAQNNLYILTNDVDSAVWGVVLRQGEALREQMRENLEEWRETEDGDPVGEMRKGQLNVITDANVSSAAEAHERLGMSNHDSAILKDAADFWAERGDRSGAKRCIAYSCLFERKYLEAGRSFVDIEKWTEAIDAFWSGYDGGGEEARKCLQELARMPEEGVGARLEPQLAGIAILPKKTLPEASNAIKECCGLFEGACGGSLQRKAQKTATTWGKLLMEGILAGLPKVGPDNAQEVDSLIEMVKRCQAAKCPVDAQERLGQLAYDAQLYPGAAELWGELKTMQEDIWRRYAHAMAETLGYPRSISWWEKCKKEGWKEKILGPWDAGRRGGLDDEEKRCVQALLLDRARSLLGDHPENCAAEVLRKAAKDLHDAQKEDEALWWEGSASQKEGKYYEAGELFGRGGQLSSAIDAYWLAYALDDNIEAKKAILAYKENETVRERLEVELLLIADGDEINGRTFTEKCKKLCDRFYRDLKKADKRILDVWAEQLRVCWKKVKKDKIEQADFKCLCSVVRRIPSQFNLKFSMDLAELAYDRGLFEEAAKWWDECDQKPKEYWHAKAKSSAFPVSILYWKKSDRQDWRREVMALFRSGHGELMGEEMQCALDVLLTFYHSGNLQQVCEMLAPVLRGDIKLDFASLETNRALEEAPGLKRVLADMANVLECRDEVGNENYRADFRKDKVAGGELWNKWLEFKGNTLRFALLVYWGALVEGCRSKEDIQKYYDWTWRRCEKDTPPQALQDYLQACKDSGHGKLEFSAWDTLIAFALTDVSSKTTNDSEEGGDVGPLTQEVLPVQEDVHKMG